MLARLRLWLGLMMAIVGLMLAGAALSFEGEKPVARSYALTSPAPRDQAPEEAEAKSAGCRSCHTASDARTMHRSEAVVLGCSDCHGGNPAVALPPGIAEGDPRYAAIRDRAHVLPLYPKSWGWPSSANPERRYTLLNREAPEYIRFVNPSDYRVAREACGACHMEIIEAAERSLMATGAMFMGRRRATITASSRTRITSSARPIPRTASRRR